MTDTPKPSELPPVDPEWIAEQLRKNEAASAKFAAWREEIGLPLVQKNSKERF